MKCELLNYSLNRFKNSRRCEIERISFTQSGQMVVESAVLLPVVLIVALIIINLMQFNELTSRFDQCSLNAVLAHGASPAGEQSLAHAREEVLKALRESMDTNSRVVLSVRTEDLGEGLAQKLSLSGAKTRFICDLQYEPWPFSLQLPFVGYEAPFRLHYQRELIVDRYLPGVVL